MVDVPVWVLDTNVLVSGLLSPSGPPGRLVDVLLGRRLKLAFDDRIEAEYREVLARPKLGIEPIRRHAFLAILQFQEHVIALPWPHQASPDENDVVFLEVAVQTPARTVVTGNLRHIPAQLSRSRDGSVSERGVGTVRRPRGRLAGSSGSRALFQRIWCTGQGLRCRARARGTRTWRRVGSRRRRSPIGSSFLRRRPTATSRTSTTRSACRRGRRRPCGPCRTPW